MEFLRKLGTTKLLIIGGSTLAVLLALAVLIFQFSSPRMSPLYSNLSEEDKTLIINKLYTLDIPFRSDENGNQILVPVDKVPMLRISLAQEGLPSSGNIVGYEVFDKAESLGTSQFMHNVNLVRALEGELSRTIGSIDRIQKARVHLVIPKKELFSKIGSEPSASIVIKTKGRNKLQKPEINAIANLVTTAVPELKVERVTIIDTFGRPLKLGSDDEQNLYEGTLTSLEHKANIENRLRETIERLVESYVGPGKVRANVAAEIDFDRQVINSEIYDPESQVVRSQRTNSEEETDKTSNSNVSVATNIPNQQQQEAQGNVRSRTKNDELINYEISKTVTNKIIEGGQVQNLSVAVLVDGTYEKDKGEEPVYKERTQQELEKIKSLVSSAVGLDPARGDKIEVVNLKFVSQPTLDIEEQKGGLSWIKQDLQNIVQSIIVGIVTILAMLLIIRPLVTRVLESRQQVMEKEEAIAGDFTQVSNGEKGLQEGGEEADNIGEAFGFEPKPQDDSILRRVNTIADSHAEEVAVIIRNWMENK